MGRNVIIVDKLLYLRFKKYLIASRMKRVWKKHKIRNGPTITDILRKRLRMKMNSSTVSVMFFIV